MSATIIGTVESLWRYPVKSMRGEELAVAFMGFSGFYGDRCYAVKNSAARTGFPYLNAVAQPQMLLYSPRFRHPEKAVQPPNLIEAMSIAPGVTAQNAAPHDFDLDVTTPSGEIVAVDDPRLMELLGAGLRGDNQLTLLRSDRALTDCRPVSLIGLQTVNQIAAETELHIDKRRFRANLYLDFTAAHGFAENELIGCRLRIGQSATIAVLERDPRCKMISLDPETGEHNPTILRRVAQRHDLCAGVYCAVLVEGTLAKGDAVELLN